MTRTEELLKLADAATPGPWHRDILKSLGPSVKAEVTALGKTVAKTYPTGSYIQDATFIAAVNPATVKQLVELVLLQHEALKDVDDPLWEVREALKAFEEFENGHS